MVSVFSQHRAVWLCCLAVGEVRCLSCCILFIISSRGLCWRWATSCWILFSGRIVGFKEGEYLLRQSLLTSDHLDTPMVRTGPPKGTDVVRWKVTDNVHRGPNHPQALIKPNPKETSEFFQKQKNWRKSQMEFWSKKNFYTHFFFLFNFCSPIPDLTSTEQALLWEPDTPRFQRGWPAPQGSCR